MSALEKPAFVTGIQTGVVIHTTGTSSTRPGIAFCRNTPHPSRGPLVLQDHGNPVRYRNIWIRKLGQYDKP